MIEYHVESIILSGVTQQANIERLKELGKEGWELVSVVDSYYFIFKRK